MNHYAVGLHCYWEYIGSVFYKRNTGLVCDVEINPSRWALPDDFGGRKKQTYTSDNQQDSSLSLILLLVLCDGFEETRSLWNSCPPSALSENPAI